MPTSLLSDAYPIFYLGIDQDNVSGWGETALAVRNGVNPPRLTSPDEARYTASPWMNLYGEVDQGYLTVQVYDGASERESLFLGPVLSWDTQVTLEGEGPHPLRARAQDLFGQTSDWSRVVTITLDTRAPTVTVEALPPYTRANGLVLAWQGSDPPAGAEWYKVQRRFAGEGWADWLPATSLTTTTYWVSVEGLYRFRVRARDGVGNQGEYTDTAVVTTTVDWTAPTANLSSLVENSPYASLSGNKVYYGPHSGAFTLTITATDATAGLSAIVFPATVSAGQVYSQDGIYTTTVIHAYTFTNSGRPENGRTANGAYTVTVTDRASNLVTVPFSVIQDYLSPTVALSFFDRPHRARPPDHNPDPRAVVGGGKCLAEFGIKLWWQKPVKCGTIESTKGKWILECGRCAMSDIVRTQIELPRDVFELLKQQGEKHGITPTQQIVEVLKTYLKGEIDPVLQADDPILCAVPAMDSGLGDLSTDHDRYLYRKDWQKRAQGEASG